MKYRWCIAPPQPLVTAPLERGLGLSRLAALCLINRGIAEPEAARRHLEPRLKHLSDPFLLPDMPKAVDRLLKARETAESVVVFGDYDVDGVTSAALLHEFLGALGWTVAVYLPNRMDEGYGLSEEAAENCLRKFPARLLLAVDCGSTAVETIERLRATGIEVLVLDHHQLEDRLPAATALVNPHNRQAAPNDDHPGFTELCSAGLAFKLAHALIKRGRALALAGFSEYDIRPFLDLVALGTVADQAPLTGENRILVSCGLDRLGHTHRPGLQALKEVAQVSQPVGVYEVGFQLGPRLNAAGRLETANDALHLLFAQTIEEALPLAQSLDARNRERQVIEKAIIQEATASLQTRFDANTDFVIVEGRQEWHIGVVGIVASRLLQEFYRPAIVFGGDGDCWRGSGRSIDGFDLGAALRECDALLLRHGGHSLAAGVSLLPGNLEAFRRRINEIAARMLKPEHLQPKLFLDGEAALNELNPADLVQLARLQPFGQQNPPVQLCIRGLTNARAPKRIGSDGRHVKFWVTDGSQTVEALWWGAGDAQWPTGRFSLAAVPQVNTYRGAVTSQLKILDWAPET